MRCVGFEVLAEEVMQRYTSGMYYRAVIRK
jgi:hypothetical protein